MFKPLIAGLAALSLTFASPAHAAGIDRDDVGKLIVGLAAIAALNAVVENRRSERHSAKPVHDGQHWSDPALNPRANRWSDLNRRSNSRTIPSACLQRIETRFGAQRIFGQRCLERNYRHANRLPERCAVRIYTNNGPRRGYDPLCLREQGYRSDRRH